MDRITSTGVFRLSTNDGTQIGQNFGKIVNKYAVQDEQDPTAALRKALYFEEMNQRRHQIEDASPETLTWIWSTSLPFVAWLQSNEEELFWISGKPASGKSTLIKYLASARQTNRYLSEDGSKWIEILFFFDFRAANGIANTREGMLRSFAVQLMKALPENTNAITALSSLPNAFSVDELKEAVCEAIGSFEHRVLAFIDGLDEFSGDHAELARSFYILQYLSGMKICLASRPEGALNRAFRDCPSIKMQNENEKTISAYMEAAIGFREHNFKSSFPEQLKDQIVKNARGVILWARFAVNELLDGCEEGHTAEELARTLDDFPQELKGIYERILNKLKPRQKPWAAVILYLVNDGGRVRSDELFSAWIHVSNRIHSFDFPPKNMDHQGFETRLAAILGSLLDIEKDQLETSVKHVTTIHKSLYCYLEDSSWIRQNLPLAFKQQIPDSPWLRMYANNIEDASKALHEEKEMVNLLLPFAKHKLCNKARDYEGKHGSSYPIIGKTLSTGLPSLCSAGYRRCMSAARSRSFIVHSLERQGPAYGGLLDIVHAVFNGLSGYFQDRVSAGPAFSETPKEKIFDLAFQVYCVLETPELEVITRIAASHANGLQVRNLRWFIGAFLWHYEDVQNLHSLVHFCRSLLPIKISPPSERDHHEICETSSSLLYDWAALSRFGTTGRLHNDYVDLWLLFKLYLDVDDSVTDVIYSGGTVLHAILESSSFDCDFRHFRLYKFLLAIKAGADPRDMSRRKSVLAKAKKLRLRFKWKQYTSRELFRYRDSLDYFEQERKDVDVIIDILRSHQKHGHWGLLDAYYRQYHPEGRAHDRRKGCPEIAPVMPKDLLLKLQRR